MVSEGVPVQFIVLSDVNATWFNSYVSVPTFHEPAPGRPAWQLMQPLAGKHDTFVFDASGARTLFWDVNVESFADWATDIRAAVEAAR
jgi:hypothetical protein